MKPPVELHRIASRLHQDVFLNDPTGANLIRSLSAGLTHHDRAVVSRFLTDLLEPGVPAEELQRIWSEVSKDWFIPDDAHLRAFLRTIRDSMVDLDPRIEGN